MKSYAHFNVFGLKARSQTMNIVGTATSIAGAYTYVVLHTHIVLYYVCTTYISYI